MKKTIFMAMALLGSLFGFAGCSSIGALLDSDTSKSTEYQNAVGTPEDSVVFYCVFWQNGFQSFSQMDPAFPADYQSSIKGIFVSKPVAPGSTYYLEEYSGDASGGFVHEFWGTTYPLQPSLVPLIVKVSKKPGLQYVGSYKALDFFNGKDREGTYMNKTSELTCLKVALKLYKGTAWEPVFQKRIEELKNEK